MAYAESCTDLDEILIGNGYMEQPLYFAEASVYGGGYYPYIHVMDDDMAMTIFRRDGAGDVINDIASLKISMTGLTQLTINPKTGEEWKTMIGKNI